MSPHRKSNRPTISGIFRGNDGPIPVAPRFWAKYFERMARKRRKSIRLRVNIFFWSLLTVALCLTAGCQTGENLTFYTPPPLQLPAPSSGTVEDLLASPSQNQSLAAVREVNENSQPAVGYNVNNPDIDSRTRSVSTSYDVSTENANGSVSNGTEQLVTRAQTSGSGNAPAFPTLTNFNYTQPGTSIPVATASNVPAASNQIASTTVTAPVVASSPAPAYPMPVVNTLPSGTSRPGNVLNDNEQTVPPEQNNLPQFARNSFNDSPENAVNGGQKLSSKKLSDGLLNPSRQSINDKAQVEKELEAKYQAWLKEQKAASRSKNEKSFLAPLSDDRAVFDDPNSPFARKVREEGDKRFVRQVTAADLTMMSEVSSRRELLDWEKDEEMPIDWSKYSASTLWSKWKDFAGLSPNEKEALVIMHEAAEEHAKFSENKDKKHLTKAAGLYEKAGRRWPDSVLEEDALYYSAECCFFADNYPKAMRWYKELITKYTNTVYKKKAVERLYYIGCYWVKSSEEDGGPLNLTDNKKPTFSSFSGAKKAFEAVFLNDTSDTGRAPDALFALANAYMRRGVAQGDASFESAARYYRQLYEFYPASKHSEKAYQLAVIALHKSYLGPSYTTRPLKQAEEIGEAARMAGKGDQKVLQQELEEIRGEQAKQLLFRGKYYEKRGNYASARAYYNRLVKEFPTHELAQEAAKNYAAIKDRPTEVDQYAWIRPIIPFIPKNNDVYFEDQPERQIQAVINQTEGATEEQGQGVKYSDLEKIKPNSEQKKMY